MRAAAAALAILLLAGCLGPDAPASPEPMAAPEPQAPAAGVRWIQLVDCVETRVAVDLLEPAFALPPGYEGRPSPTSGAPQQVRLAFQRCAAAVLDGNLTVPDVSLSLVAVLLQETDRGQGEVHADVYVVEALASPAPLQEALRSRGFSVGEGTVEASTEAGIRRSAVSGDASYEATTPVTGDGFLLVERTGHHADGRVLVLERDCEYHDLFTPVAFTATAGAMTQAMAAGNALPGYGSQAILCQATIEFP